MLYKSSTKNNSKESVGCVMIMHTLCSATGKTKGHYGTEQSGIVVVVAVRASEDELVKTLDVSFFRVHDEEQYSTVGGNRIQYGPYSLTFKVYTINQADVRVTHVVPRPCVRVNSPPVRRVQTIVVSVI